MTETCAFSGHRELGRDFDPALLDRIIHNLIINGYRRFLCGMAVGFDMLAAESVIENRRLFAADVELVACIPCPGQSNTYHRSALLRYGKILEMCDEKIVLSEEYYPGCMQMRNRYLVDNSSVIVSYLRKNRGGTHYTVNYAKKQGKKIIEL